MPNYPKITERVIKYDSPSGKIRIGKYIPPFQKIKDGYGFMGVVLEDLKSGKLQCAICGEWHENLTTHLRKHDVTGNDYRQRYGLLMSTALKSKRMRIAQSKIMVRLRKENKANRYKFKRNNLQAGNRKNKPKAVESQNKFGVCDLQIKDRIIELTKELGKTPTLTDIKDRYGGGIISIMASRYGSYIKLCREYGLEPNNSNFNPKYTREYFIEKALSNEPSIRILTINEGRAFYRYFKGIKELKKIVSEINQNQIKKGVN